MATDAEAQDCIVIVLLCFVFFSKELATPGGDVSSAYSPYGVSCFLLRLSFFHHAPLFTLLAARGRSLSLASISAPAFWFD